MTVITSIDDLRLLAERQEPLHLLGLADAPCGASVQHAAQTGLGKLRLRQKVAVHLRERSTQCSILGADAAMPVVIAPSGLPGYRHARDEILVARAAGKFGIPFTLSSMSACIPEEVGAAIAGSGFWLQLESMHSRRARVTLIQRAREAGCSVLVLALPAPASSMLERGAAQASRFAVLQWIERLWRRDLHAGGPAMAGTEFARSLTAATLARAGEAGYSRPRHSPDRGATWAELAWVRRMWPGKLALRGVLDVAEARAAAHAGVDAIIVSGQRLATSRPGTCPLARLPEIVEAAGRGVEVHLEESGLASGQDVLKALALGARGTCIGRAHLYGLAAMGQAGVSMALDIIRKELDLSMGFCGIGAIGEAGPDILY